MERRTAQLGGAIALIAFVVWWVSWRPGFIDGDAIERLGRLRSGTWTTDDPALYTVVLWIISLGGRSAALATFLQGVGWVALMAYWSRQLVRSGAPVWGAVGAVLALSLLPAFPVAMLGLWPQTVLAMVAVWLLIELVDMSHPTLLAIALGLTAAMGLVGLIAALVVAIVVFFGEHAVKGGAARVVAVGAAVFVLVGWLGLPLLMDRGRADIDVAAPIIGAAAVHHPDDFSDDDLEALEAVADLELWQELYECEDPTILLDDREFDGTAISASRMTGVAARALARHPFNAVGQRLCSGISLITPALPSGSGYDLPEYAVFPNQLGIERSPLWNGGRDMTKAVLIRTQQTDRLIWFWRPAVPLIGAALVYAVAARRRERTAVGAAVVVGLMLGTFVAGPAPRFETALPLYAVGWVSTTLGLTYLSRRRRRPAPPAS